MSWQVIFRPEVQTDVESAVAWYERRRVGLGQEFLAEVIVVWRKVAENPLLNSKRARAAHVRWRLTERFPYRVIYEVQEDVKTVIVAAVLHSSRSNRVWARRIIP